MPKKPAPNTTGIVAGLIRKSRVVFPHWCVTTDQREEFEAGLVVTRKAELVADAARDGLAINRFYVDMAVSGRTAALAKRRALHELEADAAAKKVRLVYTRDLSRIIRGVVKQEQWFGEMAALGVEVRAGDIPRVGDPSTQTYIRQNMGALHEFLAARTGHLYAQKLWDKVDLGLWVGQSRSHWGLAYDSRTKGYGPDPATADRARVVFERFIAAGGVGHSAGKALNALWDAADPRATLSPEGTRWDSEKVLRIVRNPLYRRRVVFRSAYFGELRKEMHHKIPAVLEPDLVAEADRLLALRAPVIGESYARQKAGRLEYTYGPLLRCAYCGGRMRALKYRGGRRGGDPQGVQGPACGAVHYAWVCQAASDGGGSCAEKRSAQQFRLDSLVGRALRQALDRYAAAHDLSPGPGGRAALRAGTPAPDRDKDALESALAGVAARRRRYLDLYAGGVIREMSVVQEYMLALEREEQALRDRREAQEAGGPPVPAVPVLTHAQWLAFLESFEEFWEARPGAGGSGGGDAGQTGDVALDRPKHELLLALGAGISVRVLPGVPGRRKAGNTRQYSGPLQVTLELRALGRTGPEAVVATETDEDLAAYRSWRARGIAQAKADPPTKTAVYWANRRRRQREAEKTLNAEALGPDAPDAGEGPAGREA